MPNFKELLNTFLIKFISINGLSVNQYIEKESQRRSSVWRKKHDEFAFACNELNNQIFQKDKEITCLKTKLSGVPTKKMHFDQFLLRQIDAGELTSSRPLVSKEDKQFINSVDINYKELDKKFSIPYYGMSIAARGEVNEKD